MTNSYEMLRRTLNSNQIIQKILKGYNSLRYSYRSSFTAKMGNKSSGLSEIGCKIVVGKNVLQLHHLPT
jgi:hypothetical protein